MMMRCQVGDFCFKMIRGKIKYVSVSIKYGGAIALRGLRHHMQIHNLLLLRQSVNMYLGLSST